MRHFITFICVTLSLWVTGQSLCAQSVSQSEAMKKAMIFFNNAASDDTNVKSRKGIRKTPQVKLVNDRDEYFIFNDDANSGYVIIAGEERMPEVLGYSYNGHIDAGKIPCNMQMLLDGYARQVRYLQEHPEAPAVKVSAGNRQPISQLLNTEWDQEEPYNNMCPLYKGERCITGCVATAMAQILNYYKWPNQTLETIPEYTTSTNEIKVSAISPTTIDWNNMLPNYDGSYTKKQGDAVALLMKLCGASIGMDYGVDASGGYCEPASLRKYFGYGGEIKFVYKGHFENDKWKQDYDNDSWTQIIYDELKEGCPVHFSGTGTAYWIGYECGHDFILDGYDSRGYFHVNYGWGGWEDGYYLLTAFPYFGDRQSAMIGVRPLNGKFITPYAVLDNGILTFYYDKFQSKRTGSIFSPREYDWLSLPWSSQKKEIVKVVADPSFADYNIRDLNNWFSDCSSLQSVDLRNFNVSNVTNTKSLFSNCYQLRTIICNDSWMINESEGMFSGCTVLVGGKGFCYNSECTNVDFANPGERGYFTAWEDMKWPLGDVNLDYFVDISDVVAIINTIAGKSTYDHSDVNRDKTTDISDVVKVINIIAGTDQETNDKKDPAVIAGICPDYRHPHIIDMGEAGKWACCNVGASGPWESGGFFAWGETEEKEYYSFSNYKHCDGTEETCHDIGDDIAGTQYDVAHVKWGDNWLLPNFNQLDYLCNNCTNEWTTLNGINGRLFIASNGNKIFLPASGCIYDGIKNYIGSEGYYWSSIPFKRYAFAAYYFRIVPGYCDWGKYSRNYGRNVRPIYNESQSDDPNDEPNEDPNDDDPNINPTDDRFCLLSQELNGVTYSLYTKNDKSDKHTNADGWEFYKSEFILDVTKNDKTESHVISNDLYLCDGDGQRQCMAIDLNSNTIHVFSNSKCDGKSYTMDGYYFVSPLANIGFKSERVFGSQNWGWMPYFTYTDSKLELQHFSYAGYYAMTSTRNTDGRWNNSRGGYIQPNAFEERLNEHGSVLVIEKESDPAVIAGLCPNSSHPHVIDMGEAGKWACCNVGASSPEEYGEIYAWGEIEAKTVFSWDTYLWSNGKPTKDNYTLTKYCLSDGYGDVDNKQTLDSSDDVAYMKWGDSWHIPKDSDFQKLIDYCTCVYEKFNGIKGFRITGQNGQSIFVPMGSYEYWSSSLRLNGHSTNANALEYSDGTLNVSGLLRYQGLAIRPICSN